MNIKFVLIDADYRFNNLNQPAVRLYGKIISGDDEGKTVALHVLGFEPYIYIGDFEINIFELKKKIEIVGKGFIKEVQIVKRFKPIGYQIEKSNMLKLVLFSPRVVPELRRLLKKNISEITDLQLFEADIPFHNRFLVDNEINGMDILSVNAKEMSNYGLNCDVIAVCEMKDIRVVKDEMLKIEY